MPTEIAGCVLRCLNKTTTAQFYTRLGLTATEHQHVGGPLHFAVKPCVENIAVEIYAASAKYPKDAIMLEVESIEEILLAAKEFGIEQKTEIVKGADFRFTYITDPDGRDVLLIQKGLLKTK